MHQGLPLDLERDIFEVAAIKDSKQIPTLLLVCHRVQAWLEPLLYRVLIFDDLERPVLAAAQKKTAAFLQNAVRHVFIDNAHQTWETQKDILEKCSGTINLNMDGLFDLDFLPLLDKMHLRKLSLSVPPVASEWRHSTLHRALFLSVTHLELFHETSDDHVPPTWQDWAQLASMPALTHLSLSRFPVDILLHAITECPRLVVVVTAFLAVWYRDDAIGLAQSLTIADLRLVVMIVPSYGDWEIGARGGDDFWVRAEKFVARKRKGEIEKNCYFLDDVDQTS